MKVLFLDFDGVLDRVPATHTEGKFNKGAMENLGYLLGRIPDLKIVVSSDWRDKGLENVREVLKQNGVLVWRAFMRIFMGLEV